MPRLQTHSKSDKSDLAILNQQKEIEDFDIVIPFEPEYEEVKTKPNKIYFKYLGKIEHLVKGIARIKNFDKDELMQQSYLYFVQLCEQYDPYYSGHFFTFDRYMFKNLITKLRAYIQRSYSKCKREKPSEFCEVHLQKETSGYDTKDMDSMVYMDYVYSQLSNRQREIIDLTVSGYKQQEIGKRLSISQSRVSTLKKRAIKILEDVMDDKHTPEEKNEIRIAKLAAMIYDE